MKIGIILVNYCNFNDTIECVESLEKQTEKNFVVIIVDNGSPDESGLRIKKLYLNKHIVVLLPSNVGFSAANNKGIAEAEKNGCDYVLFLNNDTVADIDLLKNLSSNPAEKTITIPKTYYYSEKNVLWDTGGLFTKTGRLINRGINQIDNGQYDAIEKVPLFTGHCVFMSIKAIKDSGLWEESFFMYLEDTELSIRMIKCGCTIFYIPSAKLWHKVGRTSGGNKNPVTMYYTVRNRYYLLKMFPFPKIYIIRNFLWARFLKLKYFFFRKEELKYVGKAIKDFKKGVKGQIII